LDVLEWDEFNPGEIYESSAFVPFGLYYHRMIQRMIVVMKRYNQLPSPTYERIRLGFSKAFFEEWDRLGINNKNLNYVSSVGLNFPDVQDNVPRVGPMNSRKRRATALSNQRHKTRRIDTKSPEAAEFEPAVSMLDTGPRLAYMDIIYSKKSKLRTQRRGIIDTASEFAFPFTFIYTHSDGYKDVCHLIPIESTKHLQQGNFAEGLGMYALQTDPTVTFISKIISNNDPEVYAVETLMNMAPSDRCNVIQARVIDFPGPYKMTLMPNMDGDLDSDLFASLMQTATTENLKTYIQTIMSSVHEQLDCLRRAGLWYTDIKPQNILFNIDQKSDSLTVQLGDLGSCTTETSKWMVTSIAYDAKEAKTMYEAQLICQREGVGALLIYLFVRFISHSPSFNWNFFSRRDQKMAFFKKRTNEAILEQMPDMKTFMHHPPSKKNASRSGRGGTWDYERFMHRFVREGDVDDAASTRRGLWFL